MTYSIFDTTGNLVEAFTEPDAADEVYLVAQDDTGNIVGETVYVSSVSVPA